VRPKNTCFSERDTGTKKDMLAVSFSGFVMQEKENFSRQYKVVKNARFLSATLVKENTAFFITAPFSHTTPHSDFIAGRQAMRYIVAVIRSHF
jgi:hypothetical protein